PIGRDIGGLAIEIDRVFGVDLDLPRNSVGDSSKLRPQPNNVGHADVRVRQQVDRAAPLAVLLECEAMALSLARRDRQRLRALPPARAAALRPARSPCAAASS